MRFAFVEAEKAHYPVTKLCEMLGVSRSGFYASQTRPESERARQDRRLSVLIGEAHARSRKTYGSPRIHAELRAQGVHVGRKRIVRLMQAEGLEARPRKRYRVYSDDGRHLPVAANLLARNFDASAPNQRWVSDTTELITGSGKLYLAAVLDLFARFVVGWAVSAVNDRHLTMRALDAALRRRAPSTGLLHHSDQGSPYTAEDYQKLLAEHGITCSMSRRGNCYDNAAMESWFSTLKAELGERFVDHGTAKKELFEYIEIFYNQQRRHSTLGYATPAEHERTSRRTLAA